MDAFSGIRLIPFVSEGGGGGGGSEGGPICRWRDGRTDGRGERRASNAVVKTEAKMIMHDDDDAVTGSFLAQEGA